MAHPASALVLLLCLYVATKFTGECTSEFRDYKEDVVDRSVGSENVVALERFIMNCIEWKCSLVTSPEILDSLIAGYFRETEEEVRRKAAMVVDFCLAGKDCVTGRQRAERPKTLSAGLRCSLRCCRSRRPTQFSLSSLQPLE